MALSPVSEESTNYEEVLNKSDSVSDALCYSGDSFDSISDESIGTHKRDAFDSITDEQSEKYLSDSFETFAGESSREQTSDFYSSTTSDSRRNYEADSFELLSSGLNVHQSYSSEKSSIQSTSEEDDHKENDQGNGLIEKWIKTLRGNLQPANSFRHQLKTGVQQESSRSECKALQSYCSLKIEHLRHPPKSHRQKNCQQQPSKAEIIQHPCSVPHEMMNRLELQRIKESINQVMNTEMHNPATCPDCCNKQAELAKCQFIRIKKTKLEEHLLNKKMEEFTYTKDLVTCIGEILQSLPKPSEERTVIWQRLQNSVTKT